MRSPVCEKSEGAFCIKTSRKKNAPKFLDINVWNSDILYNFVVQTEKTEAWLRAFREGRQT